MMQEIQVSEIQKQKIKISKKCDERTRDSLQGVKEQGIKNNSTIEITI